MSKAETNSEQIEEAARLATESLEMFRSAARKEGTVNLNKICHFWIHYVEVRNIASPSNCDHFR